MPCIYSRIVSVQSPQRIIEFDFLSENGYEKMGVVLIYKTWVEVIVWIKLLIDVT